MKGSVCGSVCHFVCVYVRVYICFEMIIRCSTWCREYGVVSEHFSSTERREAGRGRRTWSALCTEKYVESGPLASFRSIFRGASAPSQLWVYDAQALGALSRASGTRKNTSESHISRSETRGNSCSSTGMTTREAPWGQPGCSKVNTLRHFRTLLALPLEAVGRNCS